MTHTAIRRLYIPYSTPVCAWGSWRIFGLKMSSFRNAKERSWYGDHVKGGKQREVPVPREARQRLATYLDQHPSGEDAIGRIVGKYATWARLEGVTPHVLRHTFSYNYLKKTGNDLVGLAAILGHDNVTTTQIYTVKPLRALQEEIEKVQFF